MNTNLETLRFDRYYSYAEIIHRLHEWEKLYPQRITLVNLEPDAQKHEIPLVIVTNTYTDPMPKPAMLVGGNGSQGNETPNAAANLCLYLIQKVINGFGKDNEITRCLNTCMLYISPFMSPSTQPHAQTHPDANRCDTRVFTACDIDGDGRTLWMRKRDQQGAWKTHPDEPRLMIPRDPAEIDGIYYSLMPEGRLSDNPGVQHAFNPQSTYLLDEFIADHPNIIAVVSCQGSGGVIEHPALSANDELVRLYHAIGSKAQSVIDYRLRSFDTAGNQVEQSGFFMWTLRMWDAPRAAGLQIDNVEQWREMHSTGDDLIMLRWSDTELNGEGYVQWYSYNHPQFGSVELGGWNTAYCLDNPPPMALETEIAAITEWLIWHLLIAPRLEIHVPDVMTFGDGYYRVSITIENVGWLPTTIVPQNEVVKTRCLTAQIELPPSVTLFSGELCHNLGTLAGWSQKLPARQPHIPTQSNPLQTSVEWVVYAPDAGSVTVTVTHPCAGTVTLDVELASASQ